jgi:ribosomal peptide maturation radical SAM protein 1
MVDAQLVSMPFGHIFSPSIGLSLLRAQLLRHNLTCEVLYLTLPFAELIGKNLYASFANDHRGSLRDFAGEWIFSDALFDRPRSAERAYIKEILIGRKAWIHKASARRMTNARIEAILRAKRRVPDFLEACVERVVAAEPRVLGFTSVFQQHVASLALAKRVKARRPETVIVFGGANCEGIMGAETIRQFPFVDAVVSGEGDLAFSDLVSRVVDGKSWTELPGILTRQTVWRAFAFGRFPNTPVVRDLDALPYPDYSDYFTQYVQTRFATRWKPSVHVETSRGCWWGERMHCTFCGLNGATMAFRSKSADRAYAELKNLAETYPGSPIQVVDNILDLKYFDTLLPALATSPLSLNLFYETKANLKKEQIRTLRAAGVKSIQPGVENFSNQVLKLMKKGVSGLQNIQLLKWCKQFDVDPHWNFIFGFPGELPSEYQRMADVVPLLAHLPPPKGIAPIRLDRFSPNFTEAAAFGFTNVRPLAPYRFIYDFSDDVLRNLAYYFAYDYADPVDVTSYVTQVEARLKAWRAGARRYELLAIDVSGVLTLVDTRPASRARLTVLAGLDRAIYHACDSVTDAERVRHAVETSGQPVTRDDILSRLAAMVERGILIEDEHHFLALAVPLGEYRPRGVAAAGVLAVLSQLGNRSERRLRVPLNRLEYEMGSPAHGRDFRKLSPRTRGNGRLSKGPVLTRTDFRLTARGELSVRMSDRVV